MNAKLSSAIKSNHDHRSAEGLLMPVAKAGTNLIGDQ